MKNLDLCRREYVRGTRDYRLTITGDDLKTINDDLEKNGSTFAPITYEDIKAIWNNDETERDFQMLDLKSWDGREYQETVAEFVHDYLHDWIYECDYEDDLEYDDWNGTEDWSEEY